jgi:signal transduction histidine kinase
LAKRILHIEDDPDNRRLVSKVLAAAGYEVVQAPDGHSGIRRAIEERPDLVLIDINVPGLDGYEVTVRLRSEAHLEGTPIVALTAEGEPDVSFAVGCDGFIKKPIDVRTFSARVGRFLEGHKDKGAAPRSTSEDVLRRELGNVVRHLEAKLAELEKSNERLRELERLRAEFYRNLSHELSTPLTPVVGYLRLLLDERLGPLTLVQRKTLESMDSCTSRLRSLIENLLDVTALETGKMHFYYREYDFAALARDASQAARAAAQEKGVMLHLEIPGGPLAARGDPDKLGRAISHLAANAVKFTDVGGHIQLSVFEEGISRLGFAAHDTGLGIPQEALERIFDPFYQVDGSVTREQGGAGLGLTYARRVVEALGGKIWAESPPTTRPEGWPTGGTRVVFVVPKNPAHVGPVG